VENCHKPSEAWQTCARLEAIVFNRILIQINSDITQDPAAFFLLRARTCFHRRRKYPVNSEDWQHTVKETRQFIRYYRAQTDDQWPRRPAD
jgi:hypothetical protein